MELILLQFIEQLAPILPEMEFVSAETRLEVEDEVILITDKGTILRLSVGDIPLRGRNTMGVRLIGLDKGEKVVGMARLVEKDKKDLT